MRARLGLFGLAALLALGGCGEAPARLGEAADKPSTVPASIGQLDCSTLTVPVRLNNTAALATRFFVVERREADGTDRSYEVEMLAAGERRSLDVSVRDHRTALVYVSDEANSGSQEPLANVSLDVNCSPKPRFDAKAILRPVDCTDHTLPVLLDNTDSDIAAEFFLETSDGERGKIRFNMHYRVGPGEKSVVRVPVGTDLIEFNAALVDPPAGVDEWLSSEDGLEYNDYIFRIPCG